MTTADQLAWMREQLARYTHRPGWTLQLQPGRPLLVVRYTEPDSRNPGQRIRLRAHRSLTAFPPPPGITREEAFRRRLKAALRSVEDHEFDEWFRCDGQLVDDPHADPTRWQCAPCAVTGPERRPGGSWTCDTCGTRYTS